MSDKNPPMKVDHFRFTHRGRRRYDAVKVRGRGREVEVTVSPTGRSIHVFVDGKRWVSDE